MSQFRTPELPCYSDVPRDRLTVEFKRAHDKLGGLVSGFNLYGFFGAQAEMEEFYIPPWPTVRFSWTDQDLTSTYRNQQPISTRGAVLFGGSARDIMIKTPPSGISIGFMITPVGHARLVNVPADRLAERITPLDRLWPDSSGLGTMLTGQSDFASAVDMIEDFLINRLQPPSAEAALVEALFNLLSAQHDISVSAVAQQLDCSDSALRRIALRHFGFPIKTLLRRSRFMKSLMAIYGQKPGHWSRLIDASYHDQSHFIKDSRFFLGCSPREFLARPRPLTALSIAARQRVLGAPVAAMDRGGG